MERIFNTLCLQNLVHLYSCHVDSLLQVSDICKMSDDTSMAAEFIGQSDTKYTSNGIDFLFLQVTNIFNAIIILITEKKIYALVYCREGTLHL